ncbi:MAG: hypothetical protein RL885_17400 [Planctomycetota bacterium]
MIPHDERHLAQLEELLVQSDEPETDFEGSPLSECLECREHLESNLSLMDELDLVGRDEQASLAEIEETELRAADQDLHRASRLFSEISAAPPLTLQDYRRERPRRVVAASLVLVPGALVLVLLWTVLFPTHRDPLLGVNPPGFTPAGHADSFARFSWPDTAPKGGWYVLQVFDGTKPGHSAPLTERMRLEESSWTPPPESEHWPRRLRWRLEILDGSSADSTLAWFNIVTTLD